MLGPLEVVDDDGPLELSARRPRALLAALLLRAGTVVPRTTLIELLWDGKAPTSADSVLRVYVAQLRRALPENRLVTRSPGYVLRVEEGELDATRFESLLADARRAAGDGDVRGAQSLYGRALALWRGDALADLAGEPFVALEAGRLDELRLACLEEYLETELALGRHKEALPELERLAAEHPLRERGRALLMLALYRAGRQADALASYRAARAALVEELGLEPGDELRILEQRILRHDPALTATAEAHPSRKALPLPPTPTLGREREIAELHDLVVGGRRRLITLLGPGGVGKTRLALEVAHAVSNELAHGAVFVDLAPVGDPAHLFSAVGRALRLRETGSAGWRDLVTDHVHERELLLVLDNVEHLAAGVLAVAELLEAAPQLRILATSRRVLRLTAEHVKELRPLEDGAARELLVQRAAAAGADLAGDSPEVSEIVRRLDGLPLAIELAAPRLRSVPPDELARLLDSRLTTLGDGARDVPLRHRTMRAAIDWSFDLLAPAEQRLAARLATFAGGFTVDAMLAVGGADGDETRLAALVDASIVNRDHDRYRMLEVVREYAAELPPADADARAAHAAYFLALAERAEPELTGADQAHWLDRLEAEHDNLRAALDWLARVDGGLALRLAAALGRFWYVRGYLSEGLDRIRRGLADASDGDPATLAKAARAGSALALLRGELAPAESYAARALELYRAADDDAGVVRALSNLGAILHARGDLAGAVSTLDECIAAAEAVGDGRLTALACNNRGDVALSQGDFAMAADQFARSLELLRAAGDVANVARALYNLGAVALEQGRTDEAEALLRESLELAERVDDSEDVAWCLIGLAASAARKGRTREARRLLERADGLLERIGATMKPFEQALYDRTQAAIL